MGVPVDAIDSDGGKDKVEDVIQRLIDEFGSSLEESLIRVVASDHEGDDTPDAYDIIRNRLLPLAEGAAIEEATGFDPSGLSSLPDLAGLGLDDATTEDTNMVSQSSATGPTTSNSDNSDGLEAIRFTDEVDLSEDETIANLQMIFSKFKSHTIKFVLKQTGGDIERAFDELLNRQFLEESGDLAKGVDGCYFPGTTRKKGERLAPQKTRGTKLEIDYDVPLHLPDVEELENEKGSVKLQHHTVSQPSKPVRQPVIAEPSWSRTARAPQLDGRSSDQEQKRSVPAPTTGGWQVVSGKKRVAKPTTVVPTATAQPSSSSAQTAAALRRKGPLYRQGAVVFTERARKEAQEAKDERSASYSRLVDEQSTRLKIDLHNVPILDAVRISKDRVQRWWAALDQEQRERKRATHGFTVVTGIGYHSSGGFSRMRPAVEAALKNDGWKVEDLVGEFLITGRT